jgi:isochorismate hydrolase
MIRKFIKLRRRRVLLDIDTQKDFFIADGNCCIRNHRRVLMNIRRTIAWARKKKIRVITYSPCQDRLCDGIGYLPDIADHQFDLDISDAIERHHSH